MVKFYTCFPMSLDGNQLCIQLVPQCQTVKDEEAIFTALIKDSDPKVGCYQFLPPHPTKISYFKLELAMLKYPAHGIVKQLTILWAFFPPFQAILQLDSAKSARSMYSFLQQYPYNMGEHTLTCSLSPRGEAAE
ncbi:ZN638 protein, partial [Chloroceryle aenea]|nr:ZN638 protein [Chloroceryle aenea]